MNGLSITLVIGTYGGFYCRFGSHAWRICLGWIALTVYPRNDIEEFMASLKRK